MNKADFEVCNLGNQTRLIYLNESLRIDEVIYFIKGFPKPIWLSERSVLVYSDNGRDLDGNSMPINFAATGILQDHDPKAGIVRGNALILTDDAIWDWLR